MNIHFSGIGGIGMSALARLYLSQGHTITGSDNSQSPLTDELISEGAQWIDADQNIPENTDLHIYTEAVPEDDIQRFSAKEMNIKSHSYFEQIGEISKQYKTVAVCGTHGKSTITSMTGIALSKVMDPLVIVGTLVKEFGGKNIHIPEGGNEEKYFIVEACEYRKSFHKISPFGVILANCEHDHPDAYPTENSYIQAFIDFVKTIPEDGFLVANFDDENVKKVASYAKCQVIEVKFSEIENPITPKVPGWHNQMNAELSLAACTTILKNSPLPLGEGLGVREQLSNFQGTWRRFDTLGEKDGVTVIDDYAHHPTETTATIKALKSFARDRRIILAFQPHQYSRTRELFNEFAESLATLNGQGESHILLINDIYKVRDKQEDIDAVNAEMLAEKVSEFKGKSLYSGNYESTLEILKKEAKSGDIIMTMGAGPINTVAKQFLES